MKLQNGEAKARGCGRAEQQTKAYMQRRTMYILRLEYGV